jgi:hypothetical protein
MDSPSILSVVEPCCTEHIKAEQVKVAPKKRRAGKQATRYQPTGKRNDGWNSKLTKRAKEKAKKPASRAAQ